MLSEPTDRRQTNPCRDHREAQGANMPRHARSTSGSRFVASAPVWDDVSVADRLPRRVKLEE